MRIKRFLKSFIATTLFAFSSAHAYVVYNQTGHSIYLVDTAGSAGISRSIPKDGSVACAPKSKGCNGTIYFKVHDNKGSRVPIKCYWWGVLGNESGNYFIITPTANKWNSPSPNCAIEYYRDK